MTRDQTMTMTTLLLIDVQKDFHPGGSLAIPTASEDADRIASFITKHAGSINRIVVTLDTHPKWHIAHPTFWVAGDSDAADGESQQFHHPSPFTVISSEDIRSKKWIPNANPSSTTSLSQHAIVDKNIFAQGGSIPDNLFSTQEQNENQAKSMDLTAYCAEYAHRLESSTSDNRKFSLTIWPEHCIEGSDGHNLVDTVAAAISTWKDGTEEGKRVVEYVFKGMNPYTEMFSAICAEVPVDDKTSFNYDLVDKLRSNTDKLVICGQALSHCVNYTVRDIVSQWSPSSPSSITILKDCTSSVPGFEEAGEKFLQDMMEVGVNVETSDSFVP